MCRVQKRTMSYSSRRNYVNGLLHASMLDLSGLSVRQQHPNNIDAKRRPGTVRCSHCPDGKPSPT